MFGTKRGLDIPAFGDAHLATREEMEAAGLFAEKGIRLGYYRSPKDRKSWGQVIRYNGDGGLILVAPPRSGKARDVLVGALLEYDQSVIVVDPKGQLAAITKARREQMGQRVIVLNPFNVWPEILGATAHYNPMALLDPSNRDWGADCRRIAEGLIAKSGNEKDSHWADGARTLVSGVIGQLVAHAPKELHNLAQMREIITAPENSLLLDVAQAATKSPHAFIRQSLASYSKADAKNQSELESFKQNAREQTYFLSIETLADNLLKHDFCFADLKKEPVTVYIILPDEHLKMCGKWFRLIVASALQELWRGGRGKCRVLAILDEFAQIGHLDLLEDAAAAAAGHGIQIWPVLQNIPQLKKDYGEVWETFMSGSEIRQFFAPRDQTTSKYVSESTGQRTVTTAGQSVQNTKPLEAHQSSDSAGQAGQPLIRPHEISGFGPNESLIFGPRNIVIDGLRQPYFHTPEFAGLYSPDPQHAEDAAPPPPVKPESVIVFADTHAAVLEKSSKALAAGRPMFLRLLTWGSSSNPFLNVLRKVEYVLTLPLRLVAALVAAPFAIHNRPLQAVIGFIALFGFWEVWDGFVKSPVLDVFHIEESLCMGEEFVANRTFTAHTMACRAEALQATGRFFWQHAILAVLKEGPKKAATDFDLAFGHEETLNFGETFRGWDAMDGKKLIPLQGHTLQSDEKISKMAAAEAQRKAKALAAAQAAAENWRVHESLPAEDTPGRMNEDYAVSVVKDGKVRYMRVAWPNKPLKPSDYREAFGEKQSFGGVLQEGTRLVPYEGINGSPHAGIAIQGVPAFMFYDDSRGGAMLIPKADVEQYTKHDHELIPTAAQPAILKATVAYKLSRQIFVVSDPKGTRFVPITEPEIIDKIKSGHDVSKLSLQKNYQQLPKDTVVRPLLTDGGLAQRTYVSGVVSQGVGGFPVFW